LIVYLAAQLVPVESLPCADGAVAVRNGRLVHVGPRARVLSAVGPGAEVRDLGSVALVPGLVNCHTHLELSWAGDEVPPPANYVRWLRGLLRRRPTIERERAASAAVHAIRRSIARGTVAVGDIANELWIAALVADSGLHGVLFHELLDTRPAAADRLIAAAESRVALAADHPALRAARDRLRVVLTAHAPHTASEPLLRGLAARAERRAEPLSMHVAESAPECELLRSGGGPLAELFDEREFRDADWTAPGRGPVEQLDHVGALSRRLLAVHCVRVSAADRALLRDAGATVVACPRSNERLGVGQPPLAELRRDGVRLALGTDSLASAPDLDMFGEMAALHRLHPELEPDAILRMATLEGARALGVDDRLGSIEPGKLARLVAVALPRADADPLAAVCDSPQRVDPLEQAAWTAPA
jgi:cytosine/adenosine deaminase-related metal-dependent hydrolase